MTAVDLLTLCHAAGVTLTVRGDRLRVAAPEGVLSHELREAIRTHKEKLLDLLELWEERSAIAEYCGGLTREEAERLALGDLLAAEQRRRQP